jgi:hypothetical protein
MQMGLAGGIAPQADGKHWLIVTWQLEDSAQFTFKIPVDAALQLKDHFPKFIDDLVAQAKRADSGIIVGAPEVLDLAKKQFEKGNHRP